MSDSAAILIELRHISALLQMLHGLTEHLIYLACYAFGYWVVAHG
mgnify:FL=1